MGRGSMMATRSEATGRFLERESPGYVMLGMLAFNMQGIEGSIYQMLNHASVRDPLFDCRMISNAAIRV